MLVGQERREDETEGGCRNNVSVNERRRSTACKSDQLHTNMEQITHFQLASDFTFTSSLQVIIPLSDLVVFVFLAVLIKF